jgi:hypothetical protein
VGRRPWSEIRRKGDTPERRAGTAARMRQLGESIGQHTVEVEVSPVAWGDDDRLGDLLDALAARPELLDPAVGADLGRRAIGVTVTVAAGDPTAARTIAATALDEEIIALGFERL